MPQWDRLKKLRGQTVLDRNGEPEWERARLDVQFYDGDGRLCHIDVTVTAAATETTAEQAARAAKDGRAAAQAETTKRNRYKQADNPGEPLIVFAVESRGRLGESALGLLRSLAPEGPSRGVELAKAYRDLSILVQRRRAHLLRAAQGASDGLMDQRGGQRRA